MAKDLVIGFITGYSFDKLKPWVKSLKDTGYQGDITLVCYDISNDVIDEIGRYGIGVIKAPIPHPFNIVVHRFYHLWSILSSIKTPYENVLTTDVADVIFQLSPSYVMNRILSSYDIMASSENLKYKDEPWGINNMKLSFGEEIATKMQDYPIMNAGVIAGKFDAIKDLSLNIALACGGSPLHVPGGGGPDQAAYNVILRNSAWKSRTYFFPHNNAWACQCGTTVDPTKIDSFRPHLLNAEPTWDGEYALTSTGGRYVIVHQYNRVPEWKEVIEKRYE